ncbi:response regulator [Flagellimonas amoyensis]|uniref:response regulator n=1 Tax=Flagellimonas amoyensis TaxID=2169401 RepID=UPI000D3AF82E|nr:response regulator [Allomuricauda amoyensis]
MLKRTILIIAAFINVVSILAILGWMLRIESLTQVVAGLPTMKFNTAFCFILLGATIILIVKHYNLAVAHVVNGILLVIGLVTFSQDILGVNFGLDQFFVQDHLSILSGSLNPGRMSLATSLSFSLLSIALILIMLGKPKLLRLAAYMSQSVAFFAFLAMTAFFFQIPTEEKFTFISSMAIHTAIGFLLASTAISLMIPKYGIMELFIGRNIGNHLMRRLFFQLSIISFLMAFVVFQISKGGYFSSGFSMAILAVGFISAILLILAIVVPSINTLEQDRRMAERELLATSTYLNATPDPIVIIDASGKILLSNILMSKVFGYQTQYLRGKNINDLISGDFVEIHEKHIIEFKEAHPYDEWDLEMDLELDLEKERPDANITSIIETDFLRANGKKVPVEMTLNSIATQKGHNTIVAFRDISRRIDAEKNFKTANEKVLAALDASIIGIWDYDVKDGSIVWDDTMYSIYGLNKEQESIKFSLWTKYVHQDDIGWVVELLQASVAHKIPFEGDFRIVWPNGSIRYIRGKGSVHLNDEGEVVRMLGTNWDITEQKNYQLALEASTEQNKLFIDEAPTAIAMFDTNMVYMAASKKWLEDYHITDSVIGKSHYEVFPEIGDDWKKIHQECLNGGVNICDEAVFDRADGSRQWITWEVKPWYKHADQVGGLLMFTANITQFKENIMERLRLQDMLDRSNEIAKIGSWEYDIKRDVMACSTITKAIYEVPEDREPSMEGMLSFYQKEDSDRLWKAINDSLKKSQPFDMELKLTTALSNEKWVRIIGRTKGAKTDGKVYGIFQDITRMKKIESSLIKEKQKAEAASRSKSEFLANMSHEIRTPLNGVIGFTDLLMRTELSDSQREYMHTVYNSANHLLDIINDVLDFSKIEAGKLELSIEKVDLLEICDQTMDIVKHQAHAKGLEILLDVSPEIDRYVYTDPVRLRQILTNLLGNAVKFTKEGEVELKVRYAPEQFQEGKKKKFLFSIRDTGIGIAEHNLDKIFKAFDQEDASTTRKFGGTGLGLTISNRLLNFMGSGLEVESKLQQGSTFSFAVELETEEDPILTEEPTRLMVKSVLVVDDNENNRVILRDMLKLSQIESTLAVHGIEALEILEKGAKFDLMVLDFNMPYLNGVEVIQHVREKFGMTMDELPIMLLHSSIEDESIKMACEKYGVRFNLSKPIMLRDLQSTLLKVGSPIGNGTKVSGTVEEPEDKKLEQTEPTILVAEDNPVNRFLARTLLQKIVPKSKIVEAHDGAEAVEQFRQNSFDVIFMDIQMPIMSGFDATSKIRELEKENAHVPIVALTARGIKGEREKCLEQGMDDYVTKPVVYETLKGVLEKLLL